MNRWRQWKIAANIQPPLSTRASTIQRLRGCLSVLTEREEQVLLLRLQSMKFREIGESLGITTSSVNTLLVRALERLQRPRFCLNSGITVRRVGSAVEVSGLVQSRDVRERVTGVLQGIAHPESCDRSDATGTADTAAAFVESRPDSGQPRRAAPPVEAWLRTTLKVGSRVTEREMFSLMGAVVLESEAVSSEAWAIRHVAEQFPAARTRRLNPELSAQLLQMVDDHAIAFGNSLRLLQGRLHPVLGAQPEPARNAFIPAPDEPWQEKVLALQQRAEAVVSRLLQSFSSDAGAGNPGTIPDFSAVLSALDGSFRECIAAAGDLQANLHAQARN